MKTLTKERLWQKENGLRNSAFNYRVIIGIGNSMVSSAIWKKKCTNEFFKDDPNLKSLKNYRVYVFLKLHEKPYYYLLIICVKKFRVNYIFIC